MTTAVGEDAQPVGEYAAAAAAAGMSPEEYEKLMNEPQMRQLMHHIQHGSESFKIERGGVAGGDRRGAATGDGEEEDQRGEAGEGEGG